VVQQSVLDTIDDPSLRVYVVWEPILGSDTAESAQKAPSLIPDRRATHFWTGSRDVAAMFQAPIGLQPHPAWDVYLVYAPGTRWDAAVPAPEYFQHQLGGRLPKEQLLNGAVLAERVRALLEPAPAR
jgi:hypothetical protein